MAGEAATGQETVDLAHALRPDAVLMDIRMPGTDGPAATAAICAAPPSPAPGSSSCTQLGPCAWEPAASSASTSPPTPCRRASAPSPRARHSSYGPTHGGRVAHAAGFTGLGVGASRFAADVMPDLLAGMDTERTRLPMVRERPMPFPPEPIAWVGIQLTRRGPPERLHRFRPGGELQLTRGFSGGNRPGVRVAACHPDKRPHNDSAVKVRLGEVVRHPTGKSACHDPGRTRSRWPVSPGL